MVFTCIMDEFRLCFFIIIYYFFSQVQTEVPGSPVFVMKLAKK